VFIWKSLEADLGQKKVIADSKSEQKFDVHCRGEWGNFNA